METPSFSKSSRTDIESAIASLVVENDVKLSQSDVVAMWKRQLFEW